MENEQEKIIVRSYTAAWELDKNQRIYSVGNIKMPRGIMLKQFGYWSVSLVCIAFLTWPIPFPSNPMWLRYVLWLLIYGASPIALSLFMMRYKKDGLSPHKFLVKMIPFLATKSSYIEGFKVYSKSHHAKARINWHCTITYSALPARTVLPANDFTEKPQKKGWELIV